MHRPRPKPYDGLGMNLGVDDNYRSKESDEAILTLFNNQVIITLSPPALFSVKCKSSFRKFIARLVFMMERYIRRPFFREDFDLFFI